MLLVIVKQLNICYLPTPAVAGATTKVDRGATTWSGCFSQQSPSFFPSGGQKQWCHDTGHLHIYGPVFLLAALRYRQNSAR